MGGDGLVDAPVFTIGVFQPVLSFEEQRVEVADREANHRRQAQEPLVAAGPEDLVVKGDVGAKPLVRVATLQALGHAPERLPDPAERCLVGAVSGEACRKAVEHLTEIVELDGFGEIEKGDTHAAAGEKLDEPFLLEAPQGFPNGGPTDGQPLGEVGLPQAGAGQEAAVQDGVPEGLSRLIDKPAAFERANLGPDSHRNPRTWILYPGYNQPDRRQLSRTKFGVRPELLTYWVSAAAAKGALSQREATAGHCPRPFAVVVLVEHQGLVCRDGDPVPGPHLGLELAGGPA